LYIYRHIMVVIKFEYGDEKRRCRVSDAATWAQVESKLCTLLNIDTATMNGIKPVMCFLDEDKDWVIITSDDEWQDALCVAKKMTESSPAAAGAGADEPKIIMSVTITSDNSNQDSPVDIPDVSTLPVESQQVLRSIHERVKFGLLGRRPLHGWNESNESLETLPPVIGTSDTTTMSSSDSSDSDIKSHSTSDDEEWCLVDENELAVRDAVKPPVPDELRAKYNSSSVTFWVNGTQYTATDVPPRMKLVDYLRGEIGLTGTRIACGEGGCGVCTVVLTRVDSQGQTQHYTVNSCMHPVLELDGVHVTTTEGIGSERKGFHPVQKALASHDGLQCGFCSPGWVMQMYGLLQNNSAPSMQTIEDNFDGNLCRCTGYRAIFAGMHTFGPTAAQPRVALEFEDDEVERPVKRVPRTAAVAGVDPYTQVVGAHVCKKGTCCDIEDVLAAPKSDAKHTPGHIAPIPSGSAADHSQHAHNGASTCGPPFELPIQAMKEYAEQPRRILVEDASRLWFTPTSITDLHQLLSTYSTSVIRLTVGNTSIGVAKYYVPSKYDTPTVFINTAFLKDLNSVIETGSNVQFGASISIADLITNMDGMLDRGAGFFSALVNHMRHVANHQVRNVASWAGNFMMHKHHPNFPSDLVTIFTAVGATVAVADQAGITNMSIPDFMAAQLTPTQFLFSLTVPFPSPTQVFNTFKVAARHQNAHALINAGFLFNLSTENPPVVTAATAVFGGLGPGLLVASKVASALVGQPVTAATLAAVLPVVQQECTPATPPTNPTWVLTPTAYRQSLCTTLFYKFFLSVLNLQAPTPVPPSLESAFKPYKRPISSGTEVYCEDAKEAPVSMPIPKLTGTLSASGEAKYIDDIPMPSTGLYATYVLSTIASGTITSIDATKALAMPGVVAFISAKDIKDIGGNNNCGAFPGDEPIFVESKVTWHGQPIGMIVAETVEQSQFGADAVVVSYSVSSTPPIVTIKQAIEAKSYLLPNQYMSHIPSISKGDLNTGYAAANKVLFGEMYVGCQDHFYMETMTTLAIPTEQDSLHLYTSTQGPNPTRAVVCTALNMPQNKVQVTTRRVGGGFGGKLSRDHPLACAISVCAIKLNRPVRCQMSRNHDLSNIGHRHPTLGEYKVGVKSDGSVVAFNMAFTNNGGATYDETFGDMDMCQMWADNVYNVANWRTTGQCARTNLPPNTSMRAPGAVQSIYMVEQTMERIAYELGMNPDDVRAKNFYKVGDVTPYMQPLKYVTLPQVWSQVQTQAGYPARVAAVAAFNKANRWRKRGIRLLPTKYAMGDGGYTMSVLLGILADGTVTVSTSGTEVGQGLNTKLAQSVAYGLGVDLSTIIVDDNSTFTTPNMGITGGSGTSESVVAAALDACTQLNAIIDPIKKANPTFTWTQLVDTALGNHANLQAIGYRSYGAEAGGYPFTYFVYAAAITEVELDVLTGQIEIIRSDIVYDCGIPLNSAIDVGQIEGAFVQGIGMYFYEDVVFSPDGNTVNNGTWDYKPPCSQDIPIEFNVTLLNNTPNPATHNVLGSKATGEPPYSLAGSAYFAAIDCVQAARKDAGLTGYVQLNVPATTDQLQLACGIDISQLNLSPAAGAQ
jgi:xanthine dehydrogenase/oxidase